MRIANLKPSTQLRAYLCISNILSDERSEKLSEIYKIVSCLAEKLADCVKRYTHGSGFERRELQIIEDRDVDKLVEVNNAFGFAVNKSTFCFLIEILDALHCLAVNDKLRSEIYFKHKMSARLKSVLAKGNEVEQMFATRVVCQLSFEKTIAQSIGKDEKLIAYLNTKSGGVDRLDEVKKICLWNVKTSKWETGGGEASARSFEANGGGGGGKDGDEQQQQHVMISYSWTSREMCVKVKNELEKLGFRVII